MTSRLHRLDRRALFASGAAAALLAATGVSARARPERGGRLRMALSGASRDDTFDTRRPMGLFMQVASVGSVFDTLTEVAADGTLRGELAMGWQADREGRRWVFDLRAGVQFHNGDLFTADDVAASLSLHQHDSLHNIQKIKALTPHRIQLDLALADPHLPFTLSRPQYVIYPAQAMYAARAAGIGTGLYRVTRFDAGRQFIGSRVQDHYKGADAGWFDQIELVSIPSAEVRAEALRDHLIDAADLETTEHLRRGPELVLLPDAKGITHAVWHDIGLPARIGDQQPLDNLRAPERWWKT